MKDLMIQCIHCIVCVQQDYTPALNRIILGACDCYYIIAAAAMIRLLIADCRVNGVSVVMWNELHTGSVLFRNFPGPNQRLG